MNLFSFATVSLFLLFITMFCTLYVMSALSRFSAQIFEFKQYRELEFNQIIISLQTKIESINSQVSDGTLTVARLQQFEELINQAALQAKLSREDVFAIKSSNEVRLDDLSRRINELTVNVQQLRAEFKAITSA
jgi:hypothetical protein